MGVALITDGLLRKSLSTTRSLGKKGIRTVVGENSWFSPSGFSKYCSKRIKYPDPKVSSSHFLRWLLHQPEHENFPVLIPMDDTVMEIAMENQDELMEKYRCLLPSKASYKVAADKYDTMVLAQEQGVKCPVTYLPKSDEDLREIAQSATFPLLIKPRKSSGSRGIRRVENIEALTKLYYELEIEFPELLVQEYIPLGERFDVCLLYDQHHDIKASFVQKEIRHFPIKMGPSTLQESVVNEELLNRSIHLLEPLNWSGIVEVEYMMDPRTNEPVLMEINPRFWNSLDLAVQCGIDFPYMLYQLCMNEEIVNQSEYQIGRRSRWLFPGDLFHFILNPKRFSMKPSFFEGKKQEVYDDTFSLSDPLPGMILLLSCFRYAFSLSKLKMFFRR